ncbi:MAG TPA: peptidoglycan-binding domain-containing protein, partial [Verrucomicrobiae bacterium]|nr:peptidoglycan-binding domain-containing protein [Verrucomicrobiae bacterium]
MPSIANQSDRAVADSSIQNLPAVYPRPLRNAFELQLALARQALSPGSLDGVPGPQTRSAIAAFQTKRHLPITGELDEATRQDLLLTAAPMTTYVISSNDLARLQPVGETWLAKSQQSALDYESILELVSEKAQSSPNLIRRLNPALNWQSISTGTCVQVPDIGMPTLSGRSAFVTIRLSEKVLEAWDE